MKISFLSYLLFLIIVIFSGCNRKPDKSITKAENHELTFDSLLISDEADQWFARALADLNDDGLLDVVFINQAGLGGELGVLLGSRERKWKIDWIAEKAPNGGVFSCGDIEVGDIDGDGNVDVLAPQSNGEWTDLPKEHTFYWYSYPEKEAHFIGKSENYIKDVELADFNKDGKLDLAGISFDGSYLIIFKQNQPDNWERVQLLEAENIHEGMDVGDLDGNGFPDIAMNGYWVQNPQGNFEVDWKIRAIDSIWHNQTGDWSRNATKHLCVDIDNDNRDEVVISHSERSGYPLAYYKLHDPEKNIWEKNILMKELPAAHTLQSADMDGDGDPDLLTGVNKNRAINININEWPVILLFNLGNDQWIKQVIDERGIYNGHLGDFEGDGDPDIFRLISHDDNIYELLITE